MRPARRRLIPALTVAGALLAGACTTAPTEGSPRPEPTFVNGGRCPAAPAPLPRGTGCATSTEGDADGDGASDTLFVYAVMSEDRLPLSWHIRVDGAGKPIVERLRAGTRFSYPRAIGAADVDDDGRDEWFVKVFDLAGHGTAWQALNVFTVRGPGLAVVTLEGEPLALRVGGVSRLGEGAECRGGALVLLRAEAQNIRNTRWKTSARSYTLADGKARLEGSRSGVLRIDDYSDPARARFYSLHCKGLDYPP